MFYDWLTYFWQQMQAPWVVIDGMYNMPWLWVILQPLRGLGRYGLLAVVLLGLIVSITLLSARLGLSAWRYLMVLCSAPVCWTIFMGQIDGLILLGPILFAATPPAPLFVGIWVFLWWWMLWMFGVI